MTMQEHSKPSIGFIGMGHMGSHMAPRLIAAGYHLTVYDRTREKAQAIKGATVAETPKEAAAHSDVVISIVTDDAAAVCPFPPAQGFSPDPERSR